MNNTSSGCILLRPHSHLRRAAAAAAASSTPPAATTTTTTIPVEQQKPFLSQSSSTTTTATTNSMMVTAIVSALSLTAGFVAGRWYSSSRYEDEDDPKKQRTMVLPNGLPRTCCDNDKEQQQQLTDEQRELPKKLAKMVGRENVLDGYTQTTQTQKYLKGARLGQGCAYLIVTPEHLHHVVDVVEAAVQADCIVLPQGQNTGLTGGSVPHCQDTGGRPSVIVSMKNLDTIFPIDDGQRMVCQAGVGLASLEQFLHQNFPDRESHSILGSTFLNPTTAAGVAFGSGGTQCRKGPAYTERALYIKIGTNKWHEKTVHVVNTLNVDGFEDRELPPGRARKQMDSVAYKLDTWGRYIKDGYEREMKYSIDDNDFHDQASDVDYATKLCQFDDNVSRYNADTSGPDLCRSEGKVIILATVHDTFPRPKSTKTYWIGFDSLETALAFRKDVALDNPKDLPVSMEYMDRDSFDVIDRSGRVLANTIRLVGTSSPIVRQLWNIKLWIEALPFDSAPFIVDKFLHTINNITPSILPAKIMEIGQSRDHHIAMTVGDFGDGNMDRLLDRLQTFAKQHGPDKITVHECHSSGEVRALTAFRFVAAPAFRTWCVGEGMQGYSVDYALPKNGGSAPPLLLAAQEADTGTEGAGTNDSDEPVKRMRYSHFACNVVHEDLAYAPGVDIDKAKYRLKKAVEHECGGKLPAEHGHGTEYVAPPETQQRWMKIDPLNVLNPGVGGLSEKFQYRD